MIPSRALFSLALAVAGLALVVSTSASAQGRHAIGLSAKGARVWLEEGSFPVGPEDNARFGWAVAAGDFNADGYDDLVVGAPFDDWLPGISEAGSVQVRFGAPAGALEVVLPVVPWDNPVDASEAFDWYGYALAAGDFNGDGHDDLAVGLPGNDLFDGTQLRGMGGVQLHLGMANGDGRIQRVAQYSFSQVAGGGLPGIGNWNEYFGTALAFGDFNGDGRDDLAVGIPDDLRFCPSAACSAGAVMVIDLDAQGTVGGYLMALGHQGLPETPAEGDQFGRAVATGDWNGDGFDDLAIGIPGRGEESGAVLVVYGSPFSLLFANHQLFDQGSFGDLVEAFDSFGGALAGGDFNGDGYDDLAMGAPGEGVGTPDQPGAGEVIVSYGTAGGLSTVGAPWLSADGIFGSGSESGDWFGAALAAGDFDGDGVADLAIGEARESAEAGSSAGAVTVIRGSAGGLAGSPSRQLRPGVYPTGMIPGRPGESDASASYGSALASGDFDGNGFADLAIGAPYRTPGPALLFAGAVAVVYGQLFVDGFESADALEWTAVAP